MSAHVISKAELTCDNPTCTQRYFAEGTVPQVRTKASKEGWVHIKQARGQAGDDFCPEHIKGFK